MSFELSKKTSLFKTYFLCFSVMSLAVAILFGSSIAFYPGGNFYDKDQVGFSFLWSAMTDLGGENSISGDSNRISQVLYRIAIVLISTIVAIYFSIIWIFFQEKKKTRILSIAGSFLGIIQGGIFIGIGFTMGGTLHMTLLVIGPLMEFFAILAYTIVFFMDERVTKIMTRKIKTAMSSQMIRA